MWRGVSSSKNVDFFHGNTSFLCIFIRRGIKFKSKTPLFNTAVDLMVHAGGFTGPGEPCPQTSDDIFCFAKKNRF